MERLEEDGVTGIPPIEPSNPCLMKLLIHGTLRGTIHDGRLDICWFIKLRGRGRFRFVYGTIGLDLGFLGT